MYDKNNAGNHLIQANVVTNLKDFMDTNETNPVFHGHPCCISSENPVPILEPTMQPKEC